MNSADFHTRNNPRFQDAIRQGANSGAAFSWGRPRRLPTVVTLAVAFIAGTGFGGAAGWVALTACGRPLGEACAIGALAGLALYLVITGRKS